MNQCYRIVADQFDWSSTEQPGVAQRQLFSSALLHLLEYQLQAERSCTSLAGRLYLITLGQLEVAGGQKLQAGDLYWCQEAGEVLGAGPDGVSFYSIEPLQGIGGDMPSQQIVSAELDWENFDDPAGRPTQPVQVLLDGGVSALRTRFDPQYIAGEHWHDFDTLYFISDGRMQFGEEGWFEPGEIRAVHGGHSYGPERPGPDGVEFVLISVGGPVALHWSDLEPPP